MRSKYWILSSNYHFRRAEMPRRTWFPAGKICVFFAQQLPEKNRYSLWEGCFFVA
jgi:hypothetical protein